MKGFAGFRSGKQRTTPMPNQFFEELLTQIDDLAELQVTLYSFWRLALKEGQIRYLRLAEMLDDETLLTSLSAHQRTAEKALAEALERAVARQSLLHVEIESAGGGDDYYFMNTPKGRAAVAGITRGEWRPTGEAETPIAVLVDRPNIFTLYEQNIGSLSPLISEELQDAEGTYPEQWFEEAIRLAVNNNARNWNYVRAILERWRTEGKKDSGKGRRDTEKNRRRYLDYLEE